MQSASVPQLVKLDAFLERWSDGEARDRGVERRDA